MNPGAWLWEALLPAWRPRGAVREGYSLLLPVPGDLPGFAQLALDVCARQDPTGRVETLLLPDVPSEPIREVAEANRDRWSDLRYVTPPQRVQAVLRRLNDPGRFHGVQLVTAVQSSRASHVILHDADAIAIDPDFFARLFAEALSTGAAATGVQEYWDADLRQRLPHLVATWELCASTAWLRSVRPRRHLGHVTKTAWGDQLMDTTIFAQARTDPNDIGRLSSAGEFVHFNYVVSTFRHFQNWLRSPDTPSFEDDRFLLLFIRVISDALQQPATDLPSLEALTGAPRGVGPVALPMPSTASSQSFAVFRTSLTRGFEETYGPASPQVGRMKDALRPFDEIYEVT